MPTTESRTGFRLPWSADRAPSRDGSDGYPDGEPQNDDPELSEPGLPIAGALELTPDPDTGEATGPEASVAGAVAPVVAGAPVAPAAPARRPTKFLVDLTHAMQAAAEQARAATLEQFRVEGSAYVEQIQGRSVADANALRRRADEDVAAIKEWSKTEISRIREETEKRIAGRRGQLDGQVARHAALVERDIARIEGQIASFEAEMATFFDELLAETDLTILAAHAQQMPDAPGFDEIDEAAFTAILSEPAVGIPVAEPEPEPAAEPEPIVEAQPIPESDGDRSFDRDASMAAIQAAAEAAAAAEVANEDSAVADAPTPELDPRAAMLELTPDFAAAEAAAAEAAAAEVEQIPELDGEDLAARLAGLFPSAAPGVPADDVPSVPVVSTQVVVTGLVSVASIASFKRHLSRQPGVRHVGVTSGPEGEFLFAVQHEGEVSLRDLIPTLPGFQARVTGGDDGVVTASAHDPED